MAPVSLEERGRTFDLHGATVVQVPHYERFGLLRGLRPWRQAALDVIQGVGADVVHGQSILTGGAIAAAIDGGVAGVVTARGNLRRDTLDASDRATTRVRVMLAERMIRHILANVDSVVNVHPDWRVNLPCKPRASVHIPNIVDDAFFAAPRAPVGRRVLYCGGTRRIKGADVLEAAWHLVHRSAPDAVLRCVGWPADSPPPDIVNVETSGSVGPQQLAEEMSVSQLVVIPSRYEVSPIVLAEAWAAGVPAVVTDAGGMATLAPGAALVVRSESPPALAEAIVSVLDGALDTSGYVDVGRARAERHRASEVVASHLSLYDSLLAHER